MQNAMLPVAVFRFSPTEGPAYFADWLHGRGIAHELVAIDAGAGVPRDPRAYAGIAMMGGPMSVNDPLPWSDLLCGFLREAVAAKVPVLGHCLGGQLLAKAMGARVARTPSPEIGWIDVDVEAPEWFGGRRSFTTFQWHFEAFELPRGATRVLTNAFNPNQAYVLDDRHLCFQCHVEMTPALVETWCRTGARELPAQSRAGVQSVADILRDMPERVRTLHQVADAAYDRWARNLAGSR